MKRYSYSYSTRDDLCVEEGTRQLPVLMQHLNRLGHEGHRAIHFGGDPEDDFLVLFELEIPDVPR